MPAQLTEIGCRVCRTRILVQPHDGIYTCRCKEVTVRVIGPVTLVNEFTQGASVIIK